MNAKFISQALLAWLLICVSAPAQTSLPSLRMTSSNGMTTVFWPLSAYSSVLQTTTNLSPPAWTNLVTGDQSVSLSSFPFWGGYASHFTNVAGDEMAFTLPATNGQNFFRLSTPRYIFPWTFAVFYNGLLEFSQAATMAVNGRVHANGPIHLGTTAALTFNAPVTTTDTLSAPLVDGLTNGWLPSDPGTWHTTFNGSPACITNSIRLSVTTNLHYLIDVPPAGESPSSGLSRLYNFATIVLLVTNNPAGTGNPTVQVILQTSFNSDPPGADAAKVILLYTNLSPASLKASLPFLSLTNLFYDRREYKTNLVTEIDVRSFSAWTTTNFNVQNKFPIGVNPEIFYVADRRIGGSNYLAVVRLKNAGQLRAYLGGLDLGFTIATANPLYVWGDYNIQLPGNTNQSVSTTNTAFTIPAALISDSLTVLSPNWTDSESFLTYSAASATFDAADMTINAAIVTGTMPSTGIDGTNFSGGIHNLPRLLEDWSGKNLWLNTSIIRLWDSQWATNQFRNPAGFNPAPVNPYYNPPTRHFNFDQNFLNPAKAPNGIPVLEVTP